MNHRPCACDSAQLHAPCQLAAIRTHGGGHAAHDRWHIHAALTDLTCNHMHGSALTNAPAAQLIHQQSQRLGHADRGIACHGMQL